MRPVQVIIERDLYRRSIITVIGAGVGSSTGCCSIGGYETNTTIGETMTG